MSDLEDYNNGNAVNSAADGEVTGSAQPELTPLQTQYLAKILAQLAMSRGAYLLLKRVFKLM